MIRWNFSCSQNTRNRSLAVRPTVNRWLLSAIFVCSSSGRRNLWTHYIPPPHARRDTENEGSRSLESRQLLTSWPRLFQTERKESGAKNTTKNTVKLVSFPKVLHPTFTADITKQKSNGCTKHVQRHVINSDLDGTCLSDSQRKKMSKWNFIWLRIQSTCCMLVTTGVSLISWHHRGINYQLPESAGGSASIQEIKVHEWFHYRHFDEDCH